MARGELERLFEQYRTHSDIDALARAFDALAPRMLALARHLGPDAAAAEDLVQATFLAAIEQREQFDADRDLGAWLSGILTRKARLAHALRARTVDPVHLADREEPDPALDAELREFVGALERALARVPEKYRTVLRGHLAYGMKPRELARELGLPPGTVRVHLHRGLALLRRLLPATYALALVVSSAPRGHAAIREIVLEHAKLAAAKTGVATSFTLGGLLVNSKLIMSTLALIAVLSGVLGYLNGTSPLRSLVEPIAPSTRTPGALALASPIVQPKARVAVAHPAGSRSSADGPYGALDLTLSWHDGSPAGDVELTLVPRGELHPIHHVVTLRSDAAGRARAEGLHEGRLSISTDRVRSIETPVTVVRGESTSISILLPRGVDVTGRVVDAAGHPVGTASVFLSPDPARQPGDGAVLVASTENDGSFSIRSAGRTAWIAATAPGLGVAWPVRVTTQPAATTSTVELLLRPDCGSIAGVVRTADGAPAPDALVALHTWRSSADPVGTLLLPAFRTRTDAAGRYAFDAVPASHAITLFTTANFHPTATVRTQLQVGERSVLDVVLPLGVRVTGTARNASGTPLAGVGIYDRTFGTGPGLRELYRTIYTRSGSDGRFELFGLNPGPLELSAELAVAGESLRVTTEFEAADGSTHEWNPCFLEGGVIHGSVRDLAGAALAGWQILAVPMEGAVRAVPPAVSTDSSGGFRLRGLRVDTPYRLCLRMPDGRTTVEVRDGMRPGPAAVEFIATVTSNEPCFVRGQALGSDGSPLGGASLVLRHPLEGRLRHGTTEADGTFRLESPQFGDLVLTVRAVGEAEFRLSVPGLAPGEDRDLGLVVAQTSGSIEAEITLADGSLLVHPMVILDGRGILTSTDGRTFRSARLPPGTYRLFPEADNISTRTRELEVRAGEVSRVTLSLEPGLRRVFFFEGARDAQMMGDSHLVVRRADGTLVFDVQRELAGAEPGMLGSFGVGLPSGNYRLEATSEDGRHVVFPFDVIEGSQSPLGLKVPLGD